MLLLLVSLRSIIAGTILNVLVKLVDIVHVLIVKEILVLVLIVIRIWGFVLVNVE